MFFEEKIHPTIGQSLRYNAGSFRDPSGFVFSRDGVLYRQVNPCYQQAYDRLMNSGLYDELVSRSLLVAHEEVGLELAAEAPAYKVIHPERVEFISYPYEWCFSQLKEAAIATLSIQAEALRFDMTLKDCSAYNIQFFHGRATLIDTLSFEPYEEGSPWKAYRQFCEHFLAPLALMSKTDVRLGQLLRLYPDGIPLGLTIRLLPWRARLSIGLLVHLFFHVKSQRHYATRVIAARELPRTFHRRAFLGLLESLRTTVNNLHWQPEYTGWVSYYASGESYTLEAFEHKKEIVAAFLSRLAVKSVWDLGANIGVFSNLARSIGAQVIAFDMDPAVVETHYRSVRHRAEQGILPIVVNFANPSPGLGWAHQERLSFAQRGNADAVLALGLIHHLAITNNVPLPRVAEFFHSLGRALIVEFVPKEDPQVQGLLQTRRDIFTHYTEHHFVAAFEKYFLVEAVESIRGSARRLYCMRRRDQDDSPSRL